MRVSLKNGVEDGTPEERKCASLSIAEMEKLYDKKHPKKGGTLLRRDPLGKTRLWDLLLRLSNERNAWSLEVKIKPSAYTKSTALVEG
jgi:predicted acetyltransferase